MLARLLIFNGFSVSFSGSIYRVLSFVECLLPSKFFDADTSLAEAADEYLMLMTPLEFP